MGKNIIYVGVDVDDNAFTGTAFFQSSGEVIEFKARPNIKGLETKLQALNAKFPDHEFRICYEATYLGFSLQRDLAAAGYHCDVKSPSSIPRVHGNQIKTDRIDAGKLAQFYASGILSIVPVPDAETEKDRDLMRSRQFVLHQLAETRSHIQSLLRRNNFHYKSETKNVSHWTKHHLCWIEKKIDESSGSFKYKRLRRIKGLFGSSPKYPWAGQDRI